LVSIEKSFQGLFETVEIVKIVEELIEIGSNKVYNRDKFKLERNEINKGTRVQEPFIIIKVAIWCFFTLIYST